VVHLFTGFGVSVLLSSQTLDFRIGLQCIGLRLRFGIGLIEVGQALLGRGSSPVLIKKRSSWGQERHNGNGNNYQNHWSNNPARTQKQRSLHFGVLVPRRFHARVGALSRRVRFRACSSGQARHD